MEVNSPLSAACYDELAYVYDLSGQSRFSLRMVSYLLELLALRRAKPRRVVDLACGTGAAAVALAKRGFEVTGVDGSGAMIARAKGRAERWKVQVDFRQQPLTGLDLPGGYDLATCFYDSLNHLIDPLALRQAFFSARRALAPGALFLFDMNTRHAYSQVWGHADDSHLDVNYARFWRARYDAESELATLSATYFVRELEDQFKRIDITHQARGYDPAEVRAALEEAGFRLLEVYECGSFHPVGPQTYRVAYMALA